MFEAIRRAANALDTELLRTFNLGVGMALVCREHHAQVVLEHLGQHSEQAYVIGEITAGSGIVAVHGTLPFGDKRP